MSSVPPSGSGPKWPQTTSSASPQASTSNQENPVKQEREKTSNVAKSQLGAFNTISFNFPGWEQTPTTEKKEQVPAKPKLRIRERDRDYYPRIISSTEGYIMENGVRVGYEKTVTLAPPKKTRRPKAVKVQQEDRIMGRVTQTTIIASRLPDPSKTGEEKNSL